MTRTQKTVGAGLAALLLVVAAVVVALMNTDAEVSAPGATPTATAGTPGGAPGSPGTVRTSGVVPNRWPIDKAKARRVATEFVVPFSNYLPTGRDSSKEWLRTLLPYATPEFAKLVGQRFRDYWWYLLNGGQGADQARVVTVTPVWERAESATYRIVVQRRVRSFLTATGVSYQEKVSWDVYVTSPTAGAPKVAGCVKTDTRPAGERSDPYGPGEADGE